MTSDSQFENLELPSVSIVKTTPRISEEQLFSYPRCYIGISLENSVFQGKCLEALLLWGMRNFDKCLVVIGDYLGRFNEHILNGLQGEAAIEAAQAAGDLFMLRTRKLFEQLPKEKIHLTRWKSQLQSNEYNSSKATLDNLFEVDSAFRTSVEREAFSFVKRQRKQNRALAVGTEEATNLSCEYLLEEIAVFSALSEQGWQVELYPGPELRVLIDMARGKYRPIPEGLKKRVNVQLRISEGKAN